MPTSETALQLKAALIAGFPPGTEKLWDWQHPDGPGPFNEAAAQVLDVAGVQKVDQLRAELQPSTAREKLPEWESSLGLMGSRAAQVGTVRQRQKQVVSRLREWGSATTLEAIRAIVGPLLDYADPSQLVILEVDRDVLRTANTYLFSGLLAFTFATSSTVYFYVPDDTNVSPAGAQVDITINLSANLSNVGCTLYAPDGTHYSIGVGQIGDVSPATGTWRLYFPQFAGVKVGGIWKLVIGTISGTGYISAAGLFVEGLGRDSTGNDGLGGAKFQWAVVWDPALLGPDADIQAAAAAIQRINYATRIAFLAGRSRGLGKLPAGQLAAIPDDPGSIPSACIPG